MHKSQSTGSIYVCTGSDLYAQIVYFCTEENSNIKGSEGRARNPMGSSGISDSTSFFLKYKNINLISFFYQPIGNKYR